MNGMGRIVPGVRQGSDWNVKKEKETVTSRTATQDSAGGKAAATARSGSVVAESTIADWQQTLLECAEQVKKSYPGINFSLESFINNSETEDLARFYGEGVHMAIAPEFLQRMIESPEAFGEGMGALQKMVKQMHTMAKQVAMEGKTILGMGVAVKEDGTASIWALAQEQQKLPDLMAEKKKKEAQELMKVRYYKEKGGRNITEIEALDGTTIRFVFTKRINYSASGDVGRLARFTNVGNVRAFIGGRRAYINRISHDPYLDKSEVQQAVAKIKGVLCRAEKKVQELNSESSLESIRRRAVEAKKKKKAEKIAYELKRRRTLRKSREFSEIRAASIGPDITTELRYEREQRSDAASTAAIDAASTAAAGLTSLDVISAELGAAGGAATAEAPAAAAITAAVDVRV